MLDTNHRIRRLICTIRHGEHIAAFKSGICKANSLNWLFTGSLILCTFCTHFILADLYRSHFNRLLPTWMKTQSYYFRYKENNDENYRLYTRWVIESGKYVWIIWYSILDIFTFCILGKMSSECEKHQK